METNYYTYVHRRGDTREVFYVGKGKGKGRRAWSRRSRNHYWNSIVAKYGYSVVVVAEGLTEAEAHRQEKRLIKLYSREHLANLTDGGEGNSGYVVSAQTKAKLSAINMGKKPSPETIAKFSAKLRGKPKSPEHVAKLKAYLTGRKRGPMSDEQKAKISAANKGKKHSAEHIRKHADAQSKPVQNSAGNTFPSLWAAVEWLRGAGFPKAGKPSISVACTGKRKTAYGYEWRYV